MVSLLCVHSLVDAEAGALTESLPTLITLKRFFPCVQFNVAEEVTFLSKRCPTLITLEWAFTFKKDKKESSDHRAIGEAYAQIRCLWQKLIF